MMASCHPSRPHVAQGRHFAAAPFVGQGTAGMEYASRRGIQRTRDFTGQAYLAAAVRVRDRYGGNQGLCIGMERPVIHGIAIAQFDEPPQIHDANAPAEMMDHGQIMGDEQIGQMRSFCSRCSILTI